MPKTTTDKVAKPDPRQVFIDNYQKLRKDELLGEATKEILQLRRDNEILGAQVEVMNFFKMVLLTQPTREGNRPSCEDLVWKIKREIEPVLRPYEVEQAKPMKTKLSPRHAR